MDILAFKTAPHNRASAPIAGTEPLLKTGGEVLRQFLPDLMREAWHRAKAFDKAYPVGYATRQIVQESENMANPIRELDPVTHITAGAVGQPGHRAFFIQAEQGSERITLLCEKEQVQVLADSIDEMIANLESEFGLPAHRDLVVDADIMAVKEPAEPLFRVGSMALGFDASRDRILLVLQEELNQEERDPIEVRLFATRAQMQILSAHAKDVVSKGRSPQQRVLQSEAYVRRNGHGH